MRPEKIEKLIRKINVIPDVEMDRRILGDALQSQEESKKIKAAFIYLSKWKLISRLAVAAVVLIAVVWFVISSTKEPILQKHQKTVAAVEPQKSPAELTSVISLNMAFREGGMKAVERQFQKAGKKVCSKPKERLTIEQLLCELDECEEI